VIDGRSNPTLLALAVLLAIGGATVALQGLGVPIGGGFMIGDRRWTAIGLVVLVVAGALAWRELSRRR
jgi:hypothetical protein